MILDPGFNLTLRPMKYPVFYEMYKTGIKNTWTVEEVDFSTDVTDLRQKMNPAEQHLIKRLVAFFATGAADEHGARTFAVVFGQRGGALGGLVVGVGMHGEHAELLRIHVGTISPAPQMVPTPT